MVEKITKMVASPESFFFIKLCVVLENNKKKKIVKKNYFFIFDYPIKKILKKIKYI